MQVKVVSGWNPFPAPTGARRAVHGAVFGRGGAFFHGSFQQAEEREG